MASTFKIAAFCSYIVKSIFILLEVYDLYGDTIIPLQTLQRRP